MLLSLLIVPIIGVSIVSNMPDDSNNFKLGKFVGLIASIVNLVTSLYIFILFNFSSNQFQFVQEYHEISSFDFYLGLDGISVYFVLLTAIIVPLSLLSNWSSITENVRSYVIVMLLLETFLLGVFTVLDILMFYIFFESILAPLFILIGIFGSNNRVRASFYLFLYTLLGSLFLLLSILTISSTMGTTGLDALFKTNFGYYIQIILFSGIFIAFAVKTPTIFLNSWLLKAHVESPLGGSIILAAIVLKLSLYGILRLILPLLSKAYILLTPMVYVVGVITVGYASLSTLRTIDVKELIAYSSVSHAAVYLLGIFSNTIQGIEGGIVLGLAHGFVSSGLFICAGGVLYDRSSTRLITFYRGIAQLMPLFSILFFILCLGNAGTPLSLNFVGEFMSLYGTFERLPWLGVFACSSIVFSAAYTIYMFNRISFVGSISKLLRFNIPDLSKREFFILLILVIFTVILGIYPAPILDGLHYNASSLIYQKDLILGFILIKVSRINKTSRRFIHNKIETHNINPMRQLLIHSPKEYHDRYLGPMINEVVKRTVKSAHEIDAIITHANWKTEYYRTKLSHANESLQELLARDPLSKINYNKSPKDLNNEFDQCVIEYRDVNEKFSDLLDMLEKDLIDLKKSVDLQNIGLVDRLIHRAEHGNEECNDTNRVILDYYNDSTGSLTNALHNLNNTTATTYISSEDLKFIRENIRKFNRTKQLTDNVPETYDPNNTGVLSGISQSESDKLASGSSLYPRPSGSYTENFIFLPVLDMPLILRLVCILFTVIYRDLLYFIASLYIIQFKCLDFVKSGHFLLWAICLFPTISFIAVGILFSVI